MSYSIIQYPALPTVITPTKGRRIDMVVMHATGGVKAGDLWTLSGRDRRHLVSTHYYVTKLGEIYQLVQDKDIAWHAGVTYWQGESDCNRFSLGVEMENLNNGKDPYPQAQVDAVVSLVRNKVQQYKIPRSRLVRHAEIALPPGRKSDPRGFAWERFIGQVYEENHMETRIIGVPQSCTLAMILRSLSRNDAPLSAEEGKRFYDLCTWLDIDAAAVLGMWSIEGGLPYGSSALQQATRNPLNLRSTADDWRPKVAHRGGFFQQFESFQLGLFAGVLHLKNVYGAFGRTTLEDMLPIFAPASDGNDPARYIARVRSVMAYIRAH
jgi:hypothetical protein